MNSERFKSLSSALEDAAGELKDAGEAEAKTRAEHEKATKTLAEKQAAVNAAQKALNDEISGLPEMQRANLGTGTAAAAQTGTGSTTTAATAQATPADDTAERRPPPSVYEDKPRESFTEAGAVRLVPDHVPPSKPRDFQRAPLTHGGEQPTTEQSNPPVPVPASTVDNPPPVTNRPENTSTNDGDE